MSNLSKNGEEKPEITLIHFLAKLVNSTQVNHTTSAGSCPSSGYEGSSGDECSELELVERTINYIKILQKRLKMQKQAKESA